jgi:putative acetyltransferase
MNRFEIRQDDLAGSAIRALLAEHLDNMFAITPAESVHALDLEALRAPDITIWSVWEREELLGCGALKELDARHGEIKSMRTVEAQRGRGAGSRILEHIIEEAGRRGYERLSLETGSQSEFEPARGLYLRYGFETRGPFGEYTDDPNSVFMTLQLPLSAETAQHGVDRMP